MKLLSIYFRFFLHSFDCGLLSRAQNLLPASTLVTTAGIMLFLRDLPLHQ